MAVQPTLGHLSDRSPRYADWIRVFGTTTVELESPAPRLITVPGRTEPVEAYMLKLSALADDQRDRLVAHIAHRFNIPFPDVRAALMAQGCPILAEDVGLAFGMRLVL